MAFAKTHKTGGSTLQNVLFRRGVANDLAFAMPRRGWMFSLKYPFASSMVVKGTWVPEDLLDVFAFHSVWNYAEVKKILPGAVYLTLLRDPVDCFESNYVYMGLQLVFKMDINEFAEKMAKQGAQRHSKHLIGKNQLLYDLGVSAKDMENRYGFGKIIFHIPFVPIRFSCKDPGGAEDRDV